MIYNISILEILLIWKSNFNKHLDKSQCTPKWDATSPTKSLNTIKPAHPLNISPKSWLHPPMNTSNPPNPGMRVQVTKKCLKLVFPSKIGSARTTITNCTWLSHPLATTKSIIPMWISKPHKYIEMFINITLINLCPILKDRNSIAMKANQCVRITQMSQQVNPMFKGWLRLEGWLGDNSRMPLLEGFWKIPMRIDIYLQKIIEVQ